MKIRLGRDELDELFEAEDEGELSDAILNEYYFLFDEKERAEVGKHLAKGDTPAEATRKVALAKMDMDAKEMFASVQVGYGFESIAKLNPQDYNQDEYYQKVCKSMGKTRTSNGWTLQMKAYDPYYLFVYGEVRTSEATPFSSYSPVGFFEQRFPYPALSQGDRTYMSLIPHEMNTMRDAIDKAHGDVLTMGLGMGYFAYHASAKKEVTSLTVYERDATVIKLFNEVFLPLFAHPEKIHIVQTPDALEHVDSKTYDYLFVDLHHDAEDGLPLYLRYAKHEPFAKEADFWIEPAILTYFRRHLIVLIEEETSGYVDSDYEHAEDFSGALLSSLHFHLKNYEVRDMEDLLKLLSDDMLKKLAKEMKLRPIE